MARKRRIEETAGNPKSCYRAGLYARLSEEGLRRVESNTLETQIDLLREYVGCHKEEFAMGGIYADRGYSGTNFQRPEFLRLLRDIRNGRINCVIVKDLSRFGRNYIELQEYCLLYTSRCV